MTARRRLLAPEVVQTSAMDCGPAALKALLEGHYIPVSYGRLREACQTGIDGTSIDTLETLARQLGLDAEQVMLPADHLLCAKASALPCLAVVRQPSGLTHFVVLWRRHGGCVQVMDPAIGRRFVPVRRMLDDLHRHEANVAASDWHAYARSEAFSTPLQELLRGLGVRQPAALLARAAEDSTWRGFARLDALARLVTALVDERGIARGSAAARLLETGLDDPGALDAAIPDSFWQVRPAPADATGERLSLRGAVLLRVRGVLPQGQRPPLSPELLPARDEAPQRPLRRVLAWILAHGTLATSALALGLVTVAVATLVEAILLRGLFEAGRELVLRPERIAALGMLLGFALGALVLELVVQGGLLRLGRDVEARVRLALLRKLPCLHDRYFQSRPVSDMAERAHGLQDLHELPALLGDALRALAGLVVTALAIAVLDPGSAILAASAAAASVVVPLAFQRRLAEVDLRRHTHQGALGCFFLDALRGVQALRAHGAARTLQGEHEGLLVEWVRAGREALRAEVMLEAVQGLAGYGGAFLLLLSHAHRGDDPAAALLLAYWALSLPAFGDELAARIRRWPRQRSESLRVIELLDVPDSLAPSSDAPGEEPAANTATAAGPAASGVGIEIDAVTVVAGGHPILKELSLSIAPGEHVAIVGPSGAGKSSLTGLVLGWHRAASGGVRIDGQPLEGAWLARLRRETAWVDPAVQIWNRSLYDNLRYGAESGGDEAQLGAWLEAAELAPIAAKLPHGLQEPLGESGGLLSGGEGQCVRFGRALARGVVRLVVLDEPFRGLERERRHAMLVRARERWRAATLLCITHDLGETRGFPRVLVVADGRVVEDGAPERLLRRPDSRYRALLDAEARVAEEWRRVGWTTLQISMGKLVAGMETRR